MEKERSTKLHQVEADVCSILLPEVEPVTAQYIDQQYRELNGVSIPFRQLGFTTVEGLLCYFENKLARCIVGGSTRFELIRGATECTETIRRMVEQQKRKFRRKSKRGNRHGRGGRGHKSSVVQSVNTSIVDSQHKPSGQGLNLQDVSLRSPEQGSNFDLPRTKTGRGLNRGTFRLPKVPRSKDKHAEKKRQCMPDCLNSTREYIGKNSEAVDQSKKVDGNTEVRLQDSSRHRNDKVPHLTFDMWEAPGVFSKVVVRNIVSPRSFFLGIANEKKDAIYKLLEDKLFEFYSAGRVRPMNYKNVYEGRLAVIKIRSSGKCADMFKRVRIVKVWTDYASVFAIDEARHYTPAFGDIYELDSRFLDIPIRYSFASLACTRRMHKVCKLRNAFSGDVRTILDAAAESGPITCLVTGFDKITHQLVVDFVILIKDALHLLSNLVAPTQPECLSCCAEHVAVKLRLLEYLAKSLYQVMGADKLRNDSFRILFSSISGFITGDRAEYLRAAEELFYAGRFSAHLRVLELLIEAEERSPNSRSKGEFLSALKEFRDSRATLIEGLTGID